MNDTPKLTIDGQPIDCVIKDMFFREAKEYVKKSAESFNQCQITGMMPSNKEWEEFMEEVRKLDEQEFQKHKIRKEDFFKDVSKAPKWLEDEFAIYKVIETEKLELGEFILFPYDIYKQCQEDISVLGQFIWSQKIEGEYKKVLMIRGKN
jgi:hypothetical protein